MQSVPISADQWFSPVPSTNKKKPKKNDRHDIAEILLKVALTTITLILTLTLVYVGHKTQIGDKTKKNKKNPNNCRDKYKSRIMIHICHLL
jgi:hypothetical protein